MFRKIILILTGMMLILVLASCDWVAREETVDSNTVSTLAMQTVSALMTQQAFSTLAAEATEISGMPTESNDQSPTLTPVAPSPTETPYVITATPIINTPTPTSAPNPTDKAEFVKDVTIPDGTQYAPGTKFTKTWRLKNVGQATWTTNYDLVFVSGNAMDGKAAIPLASSVKPGETIDVSVELKAPEKEGNYAGYWMLRNDQDKLFGLGENANSSFWVKIEVIGFDSDAVPSEKYTFDFAAKICKADWESSFDEVRLPCGDDSASLDAWAAILMQPKFENGYQDDERTIVMHLDGEKNDWMQGFYPEYTIENGDHFRTLIGCIDGNEDCDATISLDMRVDGSIKNLGKWDEVYDGKVRSIDVDLSSYAGKKVVMIIGISNRSETVSEIFWLAPRITK